ncbi:MAG: glycosyltransferase family 4 protein, partial [Methanobacteriaceae archaeon]|nr:glycosyltransferase family 4 protein [Methanobacteriaceae archaeon]
FKNEGIFKNSKLIKLSNPIPLVNNKPIFKSYENLKILYVGELTKHKGIHVLLKAFRRIDNAKLHIYGRGPYETSLRKKEMKNVIFHGYAKGFQELIEAYKRANITVVPSICYENSPMVIYESFMHSTPVIASRIGGIPELVKDGYNGFLFEPGSTRELSRILQRIADNPETLKELEYNAFNSVKKYDIKKHINKLEKIYKSMTK